MFQHLKQTWDLEVLFPGGSGSKEFAAYLEALTADVRSLSAEAGTAAPPADHAAWREWIDRLQDVAQRLRQASAFVSCLTAQNVHDKGARLVGAQVSQIGAAFASVLTGLDSVLTAIPDVEWEQLVAAQELMSLRYVLDERRRRARGMMDPARETLVNDLSTDGYHGWSDLYDLTAGRMTITLEPGGGKAEEVSPGQAANRMSDPDPTVRAHVMDRWEKAWADQADFCALALNHLAGYRLNLYRHRGWDAVLREPLEYNRMKAETLDAMWSAINARKEPVKRYLDRKKQLLCLDKLGWQDVDAPIGKDTRKLSYEEAASFIVEQFARFSPRMAALATRAFNERWIEAEDRPGKRMGGFCTSFPRDGQSRIFVTFSGSMGNLATLAHELGHAFHQSVMNDLEPFNQQYAMAVAETASTFSEMIVADAAVRHAANEGERLILIEDKLRRAVSMLMNIHCRFLFETRFYEERRKGVVSVARLNQLMEGAQREAYREALDLYHPHFWASKLHFYITRTPFYNFPYTFGYLFSAGVYAKALEVGPSFETDYANLLSDTGRMRVEDLARVHLGVDLTRPEFWGVAVENVISDLDEFLRLTR